MRGFIDAYEAETGKRVWRFYTTAGPDDPGHSTWRGTDAKAWEHGGGSIWVPGAYDPELNLVYWGTGNAGPDYNGTEREGDNLYTASVVALDADTGKLRWHYQFTPHDIWDYDSTQLPVLADLTLGGELRKVMLFANRNGFFYVLDRATGKLIRATPFIETTWAREIRPDGRPMLMPNSVPSEEGTKVCPDQTGGTNWMAPSFDPALGLFFVTARESCGVFFSWKDDYNPGDGYRGGAVRRLVETSVQRAARDRRGDRRAALGVSVRKPVMGRRTVNRVGSGLRRRFGQPDGVRCEERQKPLAFPDWLLAVFGRDHVHGRWPPIRAHAIGHHADGVRARGVLTHCDLTDLRIAAAGAHSFSRNFGSFSQSETRLHREKDHCCHLRGRCNRERRVADVALAG